jgi:hypothetical protein
MVSNNDFDKVLDMKYDNGLDGRSILLDNPPCLKFSTILWEDKND